MTIAATGIHKTPYGCNAIILRALVPYYSYNYVFFNLALWNYSTPSQRMIITATSSKKASNDYIAVVFRVLVPYGICDRSFKYNCTLFN
jgi:hypothetical protein